MEQVNIFEQGLDERSMAYLLETTRWTKFLAIMGFILLGIMAIAGLIIMVSGNLLEQAPVNSSFGTMRGSLGIGVGFMYLIITALYVYPVISLSKFSKNMKAGILSNNGELIAEGFRHQKNMFKFMGILTIVILSFYLIVAVFAGVMAAISR